MEHARKLLIGGAIAAVAVFALPAWGFDLQAHRGGRGLAPENTLAAFRNAISIGVTTLETDLVVTSDDHLVLSHNPRLNPDIVRTEDGRWLRAPGPSIHSLTLAELRRYDIGRLDPGTRYAAQFPEQHPSDGERFPTLQELFSLVSASGSKVRLNLETKITPDGSADAPEPARFARLVVDAVRSAGFASRVTVQSFDWRTLVEVRRIAPEIETACLTIQSHGMDTMRPGADGASAWHAGLKLADHGGSVPALVRAAGCSTWSMFWRNLAPDAISPARKAGVKLLPWTVDDPAEMARLIDLGVDGIITDYPDRLRTVLTGKGMPTP